MNNFISDIFGKKVLVFGVGRQGGGTGDSEWLKKHGAIVRLSDKDLSIVPEGQNQEQIEWADIIIKNPGVSDDNELILKAKSMGKEIYTSVALFVKYSGVKTIGVTGTRGKSTTVALIGDLLETTYPGRVIRGGNIAGTSCLALFDQLEGISFAVLELSSFQLHNFHELHVSPNIAVITNLYPDHLNRYKSMDDYRLDKEAICKYQSESDICIYNSQNPGAVEISQVSKGQHIPYSLTQCSTWQTTLPGDHNKENIAAMASVAKALDIKQQISKQVVADFIGVPFRQEVVATIDGVTYINDTTSTTPTAARIALLAATSPTIWITGGDTKNLPFFDLIVAAGSCPLLKNIVILGSKNIPDYVEALQEIAGDKIVGTAQSMTEALKLARGVAQSGDNILLSPGFASFDLFKNEFDRGRQFNDIVKSYAQN